MFANLGLHDRSRGRPHSVTGFHYAADPTDVIYQVRRNPWRCALESLANVTREDVPGLVPLTNRP